MGLTPAASQLVKSCGGRPRFSRVVGRAVSTKEGTLDLCFKGQADFFFSGKEGVKAISGRIM